MRIKSQKDFFSGMMFIGIGVAFALGALRYRVGEAANMGPGYVPLMLGMSMAIVGIAITFKAVVVENDDAGKIGSWAWKPLVFILGANVVFGVLLAGLPIIKLPAMGLIAAIYALTIFASLASKRFKLHDVFILGTVLAMICYLTFIVLLKLQFPVWPSFITG